VRPHDLRHGAASLMLAAGVPMAVIQARVHIAQITKTSDSRSLAAVRPSDVRSWTARLKADGFADSYVYALHNRLS
jgi:integrase